MVAFERQGQASWPPMSDLLPEQCTFEAAGVRPVSGQPDPGNTAVEVASCSVAYAWLPT